MKKLIERLREMKREWVEKAHTHGWDVNLEDVNDANSKEEAYALGRVEQLDSILEEFEG